MSQKDRKQHKRKYSLNQDYFSSIDTVDKAYWLGFIAADGNISRNTLRFNLAKRDLIQLVNFKKDLEFEGPIHDRPKVNGVAIWICSKIIVADLQKIGIGPAKTFTVMPWKSSNKELQRAYWRGAFDGDGSLRTFEKVREGYESRYYGKITFCGNFEMVKAFSEFIAEGTTLTLKDPQPHSSIWVVQWGGINPCKKVIKYLYQEGDYVLPRKKKIAQDIIALNDSIPLKNFSKKEIEAAYSKHNNWTKVAQELDISPKWLLKFRKQYGMQVGFDYSILPDKETAEKLYKELVTWEAVADNFGICGDTLRLHRKTF